jgi:OTU domain-containing protein 5
LEDGNCLFRAVTDQVYGDSEMYDLARQMCVDYMVRFFFLFLILHCSSSW